MIITRFRGTEPTQIKDRLSGAATPPLPGPSGTGYVHHGFDRALDSAHPAVHDALAEPRTDGRAVYFTGHSLGGALAMPAGAGSYPEEPYPAATTSCATNPPPWNTPWPEPTAGDRAGAGARRGELRGPATLPEWICCPCAISRPSPGTSTSAGPPRNYGSPSRR
ncbi:hypothetical protein [Streptomyces eurythermus]|uniref:lipase family protein n=1 Tax=Streptomyces eurythermus TaxID=42237 RepID=UPI0036D3411C